MLYNENMEKNVSPSVSIVIPNWNCIELLKKHLPTVIKTSVGARIIIVDDFSTDDSVSYIQKNFPDISIVRKDRHEGFASTVNVGVREAKTDIVVLLNTDIEPEKDFLKPLLTHFSDSTVFAVGCMDKSMEDGKAVLRGRGIGRWGKGFYIHKRGEVDKTDTAWVSGGSGAFRKSIWIQLGGMDVKFNPFYWEDIDLSYRAVQAGYKILFESKSIVRHYHEEGSIKEKFSKTYIQTIAYRNQFIFSMKHLPSLSQKLAFFFWTPIRLIQTLVSGNSSMIVGFWTAIARLYL
jgi:GT2 family glycosyltransferase